MGKWVDYYKGWAQTNYFALWENINQRINHSTVVVAENSRGYFDLFTVLSILSSVSSMKLKIPYGSIVYIFFLINIDDKCFKYPE